MTERSQHFEQCFELKNLKGIHARVAAKIVMVAETFEVEAHISYNNMTVPLLSIMGLMMLSARKGAIVTIHGTGPQTQELFQHLEDLFDSKFDEA